MTADGEEGDKIMEENTKPRISQQKKPRVLWLDLLRISAIVLVLFVHAAAQTIHNTPLNSTRFYALVIYDDLAHIAVPLFVMISGCMLLDPKRQFDTRKFYSKNIFRIVVAFLFWTSVNLVYDAARYYFEHDGFSGFSVENMFKGFFVGKIYMWYLFMIFGLYIITPLVRCITKEMKNAKYFLAVFSVFGCLIPTLVEFGKVFDITALKWLDAMRGNMRFYFALGYTGYYVMGYVLYRCKISKRTEYLLYAMSLLLSVASVIGTIKISQMNGKDYTGLYGYPMLNIVINSAAVFVFFKNRVSRFNLQRFEKAIVTLSGCTFGIYLTHMYAIDFLEDIGFTNRLFHALFSVPVLVLCAFLLSLALTYIIKHIPVLNRYVV